MSDTPCGKNCADCPYKESLSCPGCTDGPGRKWSESCEIAGCCHNKDLPHCADCPNQDLCGTLRLKKSIPRDRLQKQTEEREKQVRIAEKAPLLGKVLWLLFWLIVPSTAVSFLTVDFVAESIPLLYLIGLGLSLLCSVTYGVLLLQLISVNPRYRAAGLCSVIVPICTFLMDAGVILLGAEEPPIWYLLITLPLAIVSVYGYYSECYAHAEVLWDADTELSEKWKKLWKLYLICICAPFVSIILMFVVPCLGFLGLLVPVFALAVIDIVKLVYLYRTANLFRQISSQ